MRALARALFTVTGDEEIFGLVKSVHATKTCCDVERNELPPLRHRDATRGRHAGACTLQDLPVRRGIVRDASGIRRSVACGELIVRQAIVDANDARTRNDNRRNGGGGEEHPPTPRSSTPYAQASVRSHTTTIQHCGFVRLFVILRSAPRLPAKGRLVVRVAP